MQITQDSNCLGRPPTCCQCPCEATS